MLRLILIYIASGFMGLFGGYVIHAATQVIAKPLPHLPGVEWILFAAGTLAVASSFATARLASKN